MDKCKACGKDIARSARSCPSCGHRPFWRASPVALLLIVLGAGAAIWFGVQAIDSEFDGRQRATILRVTILR